MPYTREDPGRQFGNTQTDAYRRSIPTPKVPTMIDGDSGDLGVAHHPALSRGAACALR